MLILWGGQLLAQDNVRQQLAEGNKHYQLKAWEASVESYLNVLREHPGEHIALFNLGNAYYRNNQADKALTQYERIIRSNASPAIKAKAYYNQGVLLGKQNRLEESIEAYKQTLKLDPKDEEARENLQRALHELKQQQQQSPPPKPKPKEKMTPKQIQQLLNALQEQENQLRQRMHKKAVPEPNKPEKDW